MLVVVVALMAYDVVGSRVVLTVGSDRGVPLLPPGPTVRCVLRHESRQEERARQAESGT